MGTGVTNQFFQEGQLVVKLFLQLVVVDQTVTVDMGVQRLHVRASLQRVDKGAAHNHMPPFIVDNPVGVLNQIKPLRLVPLKHDTIVVPLTTLHRVIMSFFMLSLYHSLANAKRRAINLWYTEANRRNQ